MGGGKTVQKNISTDQSIDVGFHASDNGKIINGNINTGRNLLMMHETFPQGSRYPFTLVNLDLISQLPPEKLKEIPASDLATIKAAEGMLPPGFKMPPGLEMQNPALAASAAPVAPAKPVILMIV